jgi:hypothetical protein
MRRPNSAFKSRRRQRLAVEVLEGRQLLATLTVNTAADESAVDSTLSLREAIEVSDGDLPVTALSSLERHQISGTVGSSNTIDFQIPKAGPGYNAMTGVWTIALNSALPAISKNSAFINGYSQTGAAVNTLATGDNAKIVIALDGAGAGSIVGLTIGQSGSQVRGLDIENCGTSGITVTAGGNVQVAGCFIGTGPSGETAAPNFNGVVIQNSSEMIGGPNAGDRNVISGNSGSGISIPDQSVNPLNVEPTGNQVENNFIGIDAAGTKALGNTGPGVYDYGSGNTYGGTTSGLGNVISGNKDGGIIAGGSITIEENLIGTDPIGNAGLGNKGPGITAEQDTYGAPVLSTIISNNVVSDNSGRGIFVTGSSQESKATYTIANNMIGTNAAGTAALGNALMGLTLIAVENTSILNNVISANAEWGIQLSDSVAVVQGNLIGTDKMGQVPFGNTWGGMIISSSTGVVIGGTAAGEGNVIADNGGNAIEVDGGQQNRITQNSIFGNAGAGIQVQTSGQHLYAPVLSFTPGSGSTGTLSGKLNADPNVTYTVEVFSNPTLAPVGQEQGKTFIQDVKVKTDGSGHGTFSVTEPTGIYTATATDPSGNTSPFSQAVGSKAQPTSVTTVSSSANPSTLGQAVTFTAVVSAPGYSGTPTGTVTFTVDGQPQPAVHLSVVGGKDEAQFTTSTLSAGSHAVTVSYSGDGNVSPSGGSLPTQTVNGASAHPTSTAVSSSLTSSTVGQPVTFTAIVSAGPSAGMPTGSVTFSVDGIPQPAVPLGLVNGHEQAALLISTLTVGKHTIGAVYNGNSAFASSTSSNPVAQIVNLMPTTAKLGSSANPATVGEQVTFTATIDPPAGSGVPTGVVTFSIDGHQQTPVPLRKGNKGDQAVFSIATLAAGTHSISATYDGDTTFAPSTVSTPLVQVVNDPAGEPPKVVKVLRYGVHWAPTTLVLDFSTALDPGSAQNPHNYVITGPCGGRIAVGSAMYYPAANVVVLSPRQRINLHHNYRLTVIGTGAGGVTGADGTPLAGAPDGQPGTNFVTTLNWRNLVLGPVTIG